MKTKIFIFNDRKENMSVRILNQHSPITHKQEYVLLRPSSGKMLEVDIPEDTIPFFKIWERGDALLTYIEDSV